VACPPGTGRFGPDIREPPHGWVARCLNWVQFTNAEANGARRYASPFHFAPEAARAIGLQIQVFNVSNSREIDAASALVRERPDALFIGPDPFFNNRRQQIVALAARDAIPTLRDYHSS
jgi:hypothetical protein